MNVQQCKPVGRGMQVIGKRCTHLFGCALRMSGIQERLVKAWRTARQRSIGPMYRRLLLWLATLYRRWLHRVVVIGVTGSCGKTTTTELIAAVLASQLKGQKNHMNLPHSIAQAVLRVRPWDQFFVQEIAAAFYGDRVPLESPLRLLQPQIGVVTNIGTDHIAAFHTIEATAAEKGKLIAILPRHGTAVLNADDPRVLAMQARCVGHVITYGLAPDAMVKAENIRCSWPERLSFTVFYDGQSCHVQTQLCGVHLVPCVLAALAVGLAMGLPLATAVQAVQTVPPITSRMQPANHPAGITFIRDDVKAPLWSLPAAFQFMQEACAGRKIVVIGTISDYTGNSGRTYVSVARQALAVADYVIFVGSQASKCLRAKRHPQDEALHAFYSVQAASAYLWEVLQSGDLVLLKGSAPDHLEELIRARTPGEAQLPMLPHSAAAAEEPRWRQDTMGAASMGSLVQENPANSRLSPWPNMRTTGAERALQAVVGLGNPGAQYQHTPHNIGQRVLDLLACRLEGEWVQEEQAMVARVEWQGTALYLIKPLTYINATGPRLLQLGQQLWFGPSECIMVHDDMDLPLGDVRMRMRGSDGGHRGVRSILQAFQTDAIRRIKIGVGRPTQKDQLADYALAAFSRAELAIMEKACAKAADHTLKMVASWRTQSL